MIIIASYSHTFSHSFGVLIYWNISQHTRNVWKIIHTIESPREEDQSRSSARLDTQTRQKSPAAVQMIDLAAVLAKTKNTVYSWHHQQHPKLLCCVRLGSVWNWISRIHSIQRNWNTRLMLFSDSSMSFIHLLPKTSFLRQLSMSYWGCWVTHVSFLCSKCKANYFIA